jgi:hypothetical protein
MIVNIEKLAASQLSFLEKTLVVSGVSLYLKSIAFQKGLISYNVS